MTATEELPTDLAAEAAEGLADALPTDGLDPWTEQLVAMTASYCRTTRRLLRVAGRRLRDDLTTGMEGRAFAARYAAGAAILGPALDRLRTAPLDRLAGHPRCVNLALDLRALVAELSDFSRLLTGALGLVKSPPPPVDPERARQAEEAYRQGQTSPFQGLSRMPGGE